jgi:ABC-type branched-subunit amino acid transport system substrate-binding protein
VYAPRKRASLWQSLGALALSTLMTLPAVAWSQIRIGQSACFSGPVAAGVKETSDGAKLYLDAVNGKGWVLGQPIELISLDDKFDPKLAAENAKVLGNDKQVIGMDRIGVLHVDDSFGANLLEGAQKGFASVGKAALFVSSRAQIITNSNNASGAS